MDVVLMSIISHKTAKSVLNAGCSVEPSHLKDLYPTLINVPVLLLPLLFLCHITQWINKYWIIFWYNFSSPTWGLPCAL